jgi:enamine deaminase RidA (YjgF/YER057c/UK114 family)
MGFPEGSNVKAPRGFRVSLWSLSSLPFLKCPFFVKINKIFKTKEEVMAMATRKSMRVLFGTLMLFFLATTAWAQTAEENLKQKAIILPKPMPPVGNYVPAVRSGNLLFLSGHGPAPSDFKSGKVKFGKVGKDLSVEEGYQAARIVGLYLLASARETLGSLNKVKRLVKVLGMVNVAPGFTATPKVINGCSDLFVEVFGEAIGKHARSAVGMASLPFNIPVEIEMVLEVD